MPIEHRDFSGSPGIQDLRDNSMDRDRDMRRHGNMGYDQRNNNYQRGEQGQLGRPAQELDYHSMYDDGQFSDQKSRSDDRDRGRRRYYRDRDDPRFRSLSRSRSRSPHARSRGYSHDARDRTRSRSRSPRMAGRPTDTVMIEGLPQDASPSEVRTFLRSFGLPKLHSPTEPHVRLMICSWAFLLKELICKEDGSGCENLCCRPFESWTS